MKALEILQYLKDGLEKGFPSKFTIDEAIQEIEGLENKSCEGCISYMTDIDGFSFCDSYEKDFEFNCSRGYWLEDNYTKF